MAWDPLVNGLVGVPAHRWNEAFEETVKIISKRLHSDEDAKVGIVYVFVGGDACIWVSR